MNLLQGTHPVHPPTWRLLNLLDYDAHASSSRLSLRRPQLLTNLCEIKWNLDDCDRRKEDPRAPTREQPRLVPVSGHCAGVSNVQLMENIDYADMDRKVELYQLSVF